MIRNHGDGILENKEKLQGSLEKYHKRELIWPMQIIDGQETSDIRRLSILQHQGAATGFLDFTENALVALWFACDEKPEKEGAVVILDIGKPGFATNGRAIPNPFELDRPVMFYEPDRSLSPRIVAQQSVFVICDPSIQSPHLKTVPVPKSAKTAIQNYLKGLGMSETRLFGDVSGLAAANQHDTPLPPKAEEQLEPGQYRSRGNRAYQQAQYEAALEAYESYVATLPDIAEPYCLQGDALAALGRYPDAIEAYTRAIENKDRPAKLAEGVVLAPERVGKEMWQAIYYNRGNAHAANGDHRSAIEDFSTALELTDKHKAALLYNRGNSKYMLQQFPEAYEDFESAWSESATSDAQLAMGNCKVLMREFDVGLERYFDGSSSSPQSYATACQGNARLLHRLLQELDGHEYEAQLRDFVLFIVADSEPATFTFKGNRGNTGNVPSGLRNAHGGKGYPGARGFVVKIVRQPKKP